MSVKLHKNIESAVILMGKPLTEVDKKFAININYADIPKGTEVKQEQVSAVKLKK